MKLRRRVLSAGMAIALTASVGVISAAGNALAYDASYMNKRELQQAVLRAHPGVQLGAWTQNFYFNDFIPMKPDICPSMTKKPITLPKADSAGAVGYFAVKDASGSIIATLSLTIWQYKNADTAAAAARKLAATSCPDNPKVEWETPGEFYVASGGSDGSKSTVAGNRAYIGGYSFSADDANPGVNYAVRVVGNSVVRVDAVYGESTTKRANAGDKLVTTWIDRASKAVLKFSGMDPNAA
ncbi:MAG TPA: hypothetical protein DIC65_08930 [Actinobacteria bacterium]|nr:hypothetical protein [Actinomycetota bacterium]